MVLDMIKYMYEEKKLDLVGWGFDIVAMCGGWGGCLWAYEWLV